MPFEPTSTTGTLHHIAKSVVAFEPTSILQRSLNIDTLLWVGGLSDTLHSVNYPYVLAQKLGPKWSLVQVSLSSAGPGWGHGSLGEDVEELDKCVRYFKERRPGGRVVIMGSSTGCQDAMHYLVGPGARDRAEIEGAILQAPVSDREALVSSLSSTEYTYSCHLAQDYVANGRGEDCLPSKASNSIFGTTPISARRWLSLASPPPDHAGEDDYFSSDFDEARLKNTFGQLPSRTPLLILYSGSDEYVDSKIDKSALVGKWTKVAKEMGAQVDEETGGVVPGATHNLNKDPEEIVDDLCTRVVSFLRNMDAGSMEERARDIASDWENSQTERDGES
ncbi:hypothetical protein LTR66_006528 [Elasticomyces elasticus]|nr:hypothetical protein LTR66_006528 [Elasticomyces elasticus]